MKKSFEYIKVQTAMDTCDVEDIGNVILQAFNDDGLEWYLFINTDTGYTTMKEFGPLLRESPDVPKNNFFYSCSRFEYNEKMLTKTINNFLNNPKRSVTQVITIDFKEFCDKIEFVKSIL